jgi:hypothetical protein
LGCVGVKRVEGRRGGIALPPTQLTPSGNKKEEETIPKSDREKSKIQLHVSEQGNSHSRILVRPLADETVIHPSFKLVSSKVETQKWR